MNAEAIINNTTYGPISRTPRAVTNMQEVSGLVAVQAFIWVPILLIIITGCTACFMVSMDSEKHKDTLVYAKFLANVKDSK